MPLKDKEARSRYNQAYHARQQAAGRKAEYMRQYYARRKKRLADLKRERACARCGHTNPCALDFHHRDPATKEFTISKEAWRTSWPRLMAEVAKCDILCANCHRVEHCPDTYDD